jgi:hypothetical protein
MCALSEVFLRMTVKEKPEEQQDKVHEDSG